MNNNQGIYNDERIASIASLESINLLETMR